MKKRMITAAVLFVLTCLCLTGCELTRDAYTTDVSIVEDKILDLSYVDPDTRVEYNEIYLLVKPLVSITGLKLAVEIYEPRSGSVLKTKEKEVGDVEKNAAVEVRFDYKFLEQTNNSTFSYRIKVTGGVAKY